MFFWANADIWLLVRSLLQGRLRRSWCVDVAHVNSHEKGRTAVLEGRLKPEYHALNGHADELAETAAAAHGAPLPLLQAYEAQASLTKRVQMAFVEMLLLRKHHRPQEADGFDDDDCGDDLELPSGDGQADQVEPRPVAEVQDPAQAHSQQDQPQGPVISDAGDALNRLVVRRPAPTRRDRPPELPPDLANPTRAIAASAAEARSQAVKIRKLSNQKVQPMPPPPERPRVEHHRLTKTEACTPLVAAIDPPPPPRPARKSAAGSSRELFPLSSGVAATVQDGVRCRITTKRPRPPAFDLPPAKNPKSHGHVSADVFENCFARDQDLLPSYPWHSQSVGSALPLGTPPERLGLFPKNMDAKHAKYDGQLKDHPLGKLFCGRVRCNAGEDGRDTHLHWGEPIFWLLRWYWSRLLFPTPDHPEAAIGMTWMELLIDFRITTGTAFVKPGQDVASAGGLLS